MVAAPLAFLNAVVAVLGGILLSMAVFAVVLPQRPQRTIERLVVAMRADLLRLCLHDRLPKASAYESLAYDRINQLMLPVQRLGESATGVLDASLAAVTMGLEILRLRTLLASHVLPPLPRESVAAMLAQVARLLVLRRRQEDPVRTAIEQLRTTAANLVATVPGAAGLQPAASLRLIAAVLEDHPGFFMPGLINGDEPLAQPTPKAASM